MEAVTTVQAENQHVVCSVINPNSDFARDLGLGAFTKGGLITADVTDRREKVVVLRVETAGQGNVSRGTLNPCTVHRGDLVIANLYHRSHELVIQGQNVSTFNWESIMGRLDVDENSKTVSLSPLQGYVVCVTNEKRAQKIMMGDSKIIAPFGDAQMSGGSEYTPDGRKQTQMKVAVEEVVQQGPGAVVDGMWQEPNCRPGDMIVYDTSVSPIRFTLSGQSYTLVHQRHIIMTCRDVGVEDAQA